MATPPSFREDSRTDVELVAAANAGEEAAFEVIYMRYRDWVTELAYRMTGDEALALDVLQETFLYFLRKFPGFELTANLKTFLYPAVKNLAIAARRKAQRIQTATPDLELDDFPAANTPQGAAAGDLAELLEELPAEHREVLRLRFEDGLALAEIAEALNMPLGTVKSRLHYGLDKLRQDPRTKKYFDR